MFDAIFVGTDRNDTAEVAVRHRSARERRSLHRLKRIVLDLVFPTGPTRFDGDATTDDVEVHSEHATRHAIDLARFHDARLHVLYVIDSVRYDTTVEFATDPLVEEGEETVDGLVDHAERVGVAVEAAVEVGKPATLVRDYAREHDVDLIVLNARDAGGIGARLRGDLVSKVVSTASVPVYVVPAIQPGHPD